MSAPELNSKAIVRTIYRLQILSEEIGLIQSGKSANRLLGHLGRKTAIRRGLTSSELRLKLLDLTELIQSEMETQLFLWVPPARADAYTQNEPFFGASLRLPVSFLFHRH